VRWQNAPVDSPESLRPAIDSIHWQFRPLDIADPLVANPFREKSPQGKVAVEAAEGGAADGGAADGGVGSRAGATLAAARFGGGGSLATHASPSECWP
jgi:hypothetical protein